MYSSVSIVVVNQERSGLTLCDIAVWNEFMFLSLALFYSTGNSYTSLQDTLFPQNINSTKYIFMPCDGDWNSQL